MTLTETPYGSVEDVHAGNDLEAWWILKEGEEIEPTPAVMDRDDLLYVAEGSLRLELEGREPFVLQAGELFVIPPARRSAATAGRERAANAAASSPSHRPGRASSGRPPDVFPRTTKGRRTRPFA